jgi:response regulator RpfG family c-di-GMP phosphodiesterase
MTARVPTVLCVDDEVNILAALRRLLRSQGYVTLTADTPMEGLALLETHTVDLVISDMRMPLMDGAKFLDVVRTRWPETVRLLLTGHADIESIMYAINQGEIYRYITKPWSDVELIQIIEQALERKFLAHDKRQLQEQVHAQNEALKDLNAELEQRVQVRTIELQVANTKLRKNYLNSVKVFSSLMELRGGKLSGHSRLVADLAKRTASSMGLSDAEQQEIFVAGLLHDIGLIGLADNVLQHPVGRLNPAELDLYRRHPAWGEQALLSQDDMQGVAAIIRGHHERHDGRGYPDGIDGHAIPVATAILIIAEAYLDMQQGNLSFSRLSPAEARTMVLHGRGTQFNPEVVDVFLQVVVHAVPLAQEPPLILSSADLKAGMVVATDLLTKDGIVLLGADHVLTEKLILLLRQREVRDGNTLMLPIKPLRTG